MAEHKKYFVEIYAVYCPTELAKELCMRTFDLWLKTMNERRNFIPYVSPQRTQ